MINVKYPKVTQIKSGEVYVTIYYQGSRMRLYNGKRFGVDISPNNYDLRERLHQGKILAYELHKVLSSGTPIETQKEIKQTDLEILRKALKSKIMGANSPQHKRMLNYVFSLIAAQMNSDSLTYEVMDKVLSSYDNPTSYNTIRAYIRNICNEASKYGLETSYLKQIKRKRQKERLHAPIEDVQLLLEEIHEFSKTLFICCLLVYGCLLRPHREVRELSWGDFSQDLKYIFLSGNRNKSSKNRVVPVPHYVRVHLSKKEEQLNIFSGREKAFSSDYFKTLWRRFRKNSIYLKPEQTLYSFRHTGAIDIYKRTGSIEKLKTAMGHSNIVVTLTYLRGLEQTDLKEDDMPLLGPVKL